MENNLEVTLHKTVHLNDEAETEADILSRTRLKIFPYTEKLLGKRIKGDVLDIGAGNGYAGAWLAKNRETMVTSLECTEEAVHKTIPKTKELLGVGNNLVPVIGSINDLGPYRGKIDYVICFGVIHHSEDLLDAVKNIYACLRPGGVLIAQEPCVSDHVQNDTFRNIYDSKELFADIEIRHGDRNDIFHRTCEYLTAFYFCDFEILHVTNANKITNTIISRAKNSIKRLLRRNVPNRPDKFKLYRTQTLRPESTLFVCKKPVDNAGVIPHIWGKLL